MVEHSEFTLEDSSSVAVQILGFVPSEEMSLEGLCSVSVVMAASVCAGSLFHLHLVEGDFSSPC